WPAKRQHGNRRHPTSLTVDKSRIQETTLAEVPFLNKLLLMRRNLVLLLCCLLMTFPGCQKRETPPPSPRQVCTLITLDDIQAVQGSPFKEAKSSARSDAGFRVSQCFY